MRQILMSKPGEFSFKDKADYLRGTAIKMLANLIEKSGDREAVEKVVVISNIALKRTHAERR